MYQALYRKYRPQTFDDVVGQTTVVKVLKNSISQHKFCHAYMFFGSRGTGKTSLSKIFAKAVNCLEPVDGNPCGKCKNCLIASEKECVDILEIDAASNNGVDEIRELRNKINLVPGELKYKVYIIDEVHMLSIGAFNALLKTLEEPPEHAIFILATTDPQKVPETIISRCQCFSFERISTDMIVERLKYVCNQENILIEDDVLREIAISSDGGMRDSLGILDKLSSYTSDLITMDIYIELNGLITKKDLKTLCDFVFTANYKEVLNQINSFNNSGKNLIQILSQFMYYLRDLLIDYYVEQNSINYSVLLVEKLITSINEKMFDIKKSGNPKIYIEILLLNFMSDISDSNSTKSVDNKVSSIKNTLVEKNSNDNAGHNNVVNDDKYENVESVEFKMKNEDILTNSNDDAISQDDLSTVDKKVVDNFNTGDILNIDDIIKVRINNAFALANKQVLNHEIDNLKLLNDYTFDQKIGYLVCELLNSKFRVASDDIIVLSYEYESIVQQNLLHLEQMEEVYSDITHSSKKFAIISDLEWDKLKKEYIQHLKEGNHYEVLEEPEKVFKKEETDDIISSDASMLFGDIVEID
mgnify:FL=1